MSDLTPEAVTEADVRAMLKNTQEEMKLHRLSYHPQEALCRSWLAQREEIERLTADYPSGDQDGQARAWGAVWKECVDAGMLSHFSSSSTGRGFATH